VLTHSRAGIFALAAQAWDCAASDRPLLPERRAAITAGCIEAVARLRRGAAELVALAGMTAIQMGHPLARAWRDLQALAAHVSVSPRALADSGGALLRAPPQ
jgi:hypothetical protein